MAAMAFVELVLGESWIVEQVFMWKLYVYYNKHKGMQVLKLLRQILFVQPYGREKY
jgi:hypothetical protein